MKKQSKITPYGKFWLGVYAFGLLLLIALIFDPHQMIGRVKFYLFGPGVPTVAVESAIDPSFSPTGTFDKLASTISLFVDDPDIGEGVRDILARADAYRTFLSKNLIRVNESQIDFVGQAHFDDVRGLDNRIIKSQSKIKHFLGLKLYDLVAGEGVCASRIDKQSLDREMYDLLMQDRRKRERIEMENRFKIDFSSFESFSNSPHIKRSNPFSSSRSQHDAVIMHSLDRPDVVFGAEDSHLLSLHHQILMFDRDRVSSEKARVFLEIAEMASQIRLEYAYAKIVSRMKLNRAGKGVIVFGYGHAEQFRELAAKIGQVARIYNFSGY